MEGEVKVNEVERVWCGGRRFRLSSWPFSVVWATCTHAAWLEDRLSQSVGRMLKTCGIPERWRRCRFLGTAESLFVRLAGRGALQAFSPVVRAIRIHCIPLPDVPRRPSMIGLAEQQRSGVRCGVQSLRDKWTKRASMRLIILCQGNGSYNTSHCRAALHGSTTSLSPSWPPSPMLPCWTRYFLLRTQRNRPVFLAKWESAKHLPRRVSIQISYRRRQ